MLRPTSDQVLGLKHRVIDRPAHPDRAGEPMQADPPSDVAQWDQDRWHAVQWVVVAR